MPLLSRGSDAISPTAHYTGYVWSRNGLSHPELTTREGWMLFQSLRPMMAVTGTLGGPVLEEYLLARHRRIDALLGRAIEDGRVSQVVEVACGLSPRGWRFTQRYGDRLTYVEADLPDMAVRKRLALARMGSLSARHRVEEVDALIGDGPASLRSLVASLDPEAGLALVTEGLVGYFERAQVLAMWARFAGVLGDFPAGVYISDLHLAEDMGGPHLRVFRAVLSAFVRGRVHVHFGDAAEAASALERSGFAEVLVHRGDPDGDPRHDSPGAGRLRVVEAGLG
jgi:O-methyltransferase involved in polyketide biosynthesis